MKKALRARGRKGMENIRHFAIGLGVSLAVTALCVVLFALVIQLFDLGDGWITPVNQGIKVLAICLGTLVAKNAPMRSFQMGMAIGLAYMALGIVVYSLIDLTMLPFYVIAGDLALGGGAGFLSGLLAATLKKDE